MIKPKKPEWIFFLIEGVLTVLHFVEGVKKAFPHPEEAFVYIAVGQMLAIALYVAFRWMSVEESIENAHQKLETKLDALTQVTLLTADAFYEDFERENDRASHAVSISHLDKRPPRLADGSGESRYFANMRKVIDRNSPKSFRRIERLSLEKKDWIHRVVQACQGAKNYSLRGLSLREAGERSLVVSAQVIDSEITYLVDVARQQDGHSTRDIKIVDEEFAAKWLSYYNDVLWTRSLPIIENGKLVDEKWAEKLV